MTDSFTGSIGGTDLDPLDDGTLDLSTLGTILDAVGVSDSAADDATLYGGILGGSDILYNGEFEPLNVFRDSSTGDWYQSVTVDFGGLDEHIGIFDASGATGGEIPVGDFSGDPTSTSFGVTNPGITAIPEPSAALLGGLGLLGRRRAY